MQVKIEIDTSSKTALKTFCSNVPKLMDNLTGGFNCDIKINANFKR